MSELSPVANNNTIESSLASILTGISSLDSGVSLKDSANLDAFWLADDARRALRDAAPFLEGR